MNRVKKEKKINAAILYDYHSIDQSLIFSGS